MIMSELSNDKKENIGNYIAEVFSLKRVPLRGMPGRGYKTGWGTKSAIGVYETFMALAHDLMKDGDHGRQVSDRL
jgi:hypothetical protein